MIQNLHTHTSFDDGQNTPEEMIRAAKAAGISSLGFSVHTPMPFPACWTISKERVGDYIAEIHRLKDAYRGEIEVFCGAEWDLHSADLPTGFDYVIGSIHHIPDGDGLGCVDNSAEETRRMLANNYSWDADAFAEAYFQLYQDIAACDQVDIVGHFDLLTKFDEQDAFFRADSERYQAAANAAIDVLIASGKLFEINTGAISRGYRTTPYPSRTLLKRIHQRGGRIVIGSDAHRAEDIAFGLNQAMKLAHDSGFTELWQFDGKEFFPTKIAID